MKAPRNIVIVGGPNGSGKTTFARSFLSRTAAVPVFLNPDLIAAGISPHAYEAAAFQAGRVLLAEAKGHLSRGESFGFESTLSGKTWGPLLKRARDAGYSLTVHFLFVDSATLSLKRIKQRVSEGGHNIPRNTVFRRRLRCFENFWHLYRPLADAWYLFNNSGTSPRLVASMNTFETWDTRRQQKFAARFLKGRIDD